MPRHPVLAALLLVTPSFDACDPGGVFRIHPAPALAAGEAFVEGIDDLPLMPGLIGMADQSLVFDKPDGRIVQAVATGRMPAATVKSFYADTAPQLGWNPAGDGRFTRDGESLRIELIGANAPGGALTVRFLLNPQ